MWSRLQGHVGEAEQDRLHLLKEMGADEVYDSSLLSSMRIGTDPASRNIDLRQRFLSPVIGFGPGEYQSVDDLENAKKAVYWARQQAGALEPGQRFPSPQLGLGPGEFATDAELENAKKAVMWSRLRGQVGIAVNERLTFLASEGADEYDGGYLSDFGCLISSKLSPLDLRNRFPSPVYGLGPGEYQSIEEYETAQNAVLWARQQAPLLPPGERFPSPQYGLGPGEFASEAELEAGKKAIMWSRVRGQVGEAKVARLEFLIASGADVEYDTGVLNLDRKVVKAGVESAATRFLSPKFGVGPGEYESLEDLMQAKKAVYWAREQAALIAPGQRFPSPQLGLGPGEYASEADLENAKKAIMWSRVRGQIGEAEQQRLKVSLYRMSFK